MRGMIRVRLGAAGQVGNVCVGSELIVPVRPDDSYATTGIVFGLEYSSKYNRIR